MTKPVIMIGGGGHARVLWHVLHLAGRKILGFTDKRSQADLAGCGNLKCLGDDAVIERDYSSQDIELVNALGKVGASTLRGEIFEKFKGLGYSFSRVIHPSTFIADDREMSDGIQIMAAAVLQPGIKLGENVLVNTGAIIEHDCLVGAHTHIGPGVILCGEVRVGSNVLVGAGARVIQGVTIGDNAVIGAGSVILRDIPAGSTVVGTGRLVGEK